MKRWIHAATSSSHPVKDSSIRKVFDKVWEWEDGNKEGFFDSLDKGYHERQLPSALLADPDYMMDLAEQYAEYREAQDDGFEFDTEGADKFVESIISQYPHLHVNVDKVVSKLVPSRLKYIFALDEYPSMELDTEINLAPNSAFEPLPREKDSIIKIIEELEDSSFLIDKFIQNYSGLLDTFYGEYLDILKSEYKDYLAVSQYDDPFLIAIWFEYLDERRLGQELYKKGYIDRPYGLDAIEFLKPLFESYGLDSFKGIKYPVCNVDIEDL